MAVALAVSLATAVTLAIRIGHNRDRDADAVLRPDAPGGPLPRLYTVGNFDFVDPAGRTVTQDDLRGGPWVAMLFFSSCKSICPGMIGRMSTLQETIPDPRIKIVSFTLDPEKDTPEKLQQYQKQVGADPSRWYFLRAKPGQDVFAFARERLKLAATPRTDTEDINHPPYVLLVDGQGVVRGVYDGTDDAAMKQLNTDATALADEKPAAK
jgi:cytochrome oxidase Cu insertion factor (SCO1/SenC/PrrC family)